MSSAAIRKRLQRWFCKEPPPSVPLAQRQLVISLGVMKSGTTWLSDYLSSHPTFFHSPIKEMSAFRLCSLRMLGAPVTSISLLSLLSLANGADCVVVWPIAAPP